MNTSANIAHLKESLVQEIVSMCERITAYGHYPDNLFMEAVSILKRHRDFGITQQIAYEAILPFYQTYPNGSAQEMFINDILDCLSDFIGNKEYRIYDHN